MQEVVSGGGGNEPSHESASECQGQVQRSIRFGELGTENRAKCA